MSMILLTFLTFHSPRERPGGLRIGAGVIDRDDALTRPEREDDLRGGGQEHDEAPRRSGIRRRLGPGASLARRERGREREERAYSTGSMPAHAVKSASQWVARHVSQSGLLGLRHWRAQF